MRTNVYIQEKEMQEQNLAWFVGFLKYLRIKLNNLQTKPIFAYVFLFLADVHISSHCELINIWSRKNIK